ncbi:TagK domain-containing protein, partial [Pelomonas sp. KK5]|uniref:TagK domain-containing protein n=1 Tax=Pelomonas sp. KK5 TaxID=1855730 RepID=UPI0011812E9E
YDLVETAPPIDDLLQTLAADLEPDTLLLPETDVSILHLLAPDHQRAHEVDGAVTEAALPLLTRKEHHDLALDSALASLFGGARPAQESGP